MASPTINFRLIRSHQGSQHSGFEELVCQLAALDTSAGLPFHRKGQGADGGIECYRVEADGAETGWQAKYFFELGSSEAAQLKKSFANAIATHPKLTRFIVCLPFDLSDARIEGHKTERRRWEDWIKARQDFIAPRVVDIQLWGGFQLTERLSRSDALHVGRRTYWFDVPHFCAGWFQERFAIARSALGRRYSPELNIELPIRQVLSGLARDPDFERQIASWADNLDEVRHRCRAEISRALGTSQATATKKLDEQLAELVMALRSSFLSPAEPVPHDVWSNLLRLVSSTLEGVSLKLWELRQSRGERERAQNGLYYTALVREAIARVVDAIEAPATQLANSHRLLINGEAGVGKSHLLAEFAEQHIARGFPAVLLLGGMFSDSDPWRQIADQLGLSEVPTDAILGALDSAAEASRVRAMVIVDAINERNGIAVWSTRLAAFLATADRFVHVAVVVSCRSAFIPYIVKDLDASSLPQLEHRGFIGRAAEATRRYLDQRGIVRMAVPNLAPEFENPLFLRTCCDMLERRGERQLPRGLAGVSSIFDYYFGAVAETLSQRMGLAPRQKRVERAIAALTEAMVSAGYGYLPLDVAEDVLERVHASAGRADQSLFVQLENEGVISIEPVHNGEIAIEMVRFTFERLSDHCIARRLLDTHVGEGDPRGAFSKDDPLASYVAGRFSGVAEALAVQLPERYGVEILDAVDEPLTRRKLVHAFQLSLLWRRQEVFSERTLELVEEWSESMGDDSVLETLISIATEPNNRFNADYLDQRLRRLSAPDRDVQWSMPATRIAEDSESAIATLLQWVLANGLEQIEPARARLAAISLAWFTSLSHRWARDMATKALATLLVDRRALAVEMICNFADVNDAYVVDRTLAGAYGAATRRSDDEGLAELSRAAFAAVFSRGELPSHALVRDHARGIIELAASRGVLPSDVSLQSARPPYRRGAPLDVIPESTINAYVQNHGRYSYRDAICSSAAEDGDFARYEIDSLAENFLLLPREEFGRSMHEIYDDWRKVAISPYPDREVALERIVAASLHIHSLPNRFADFRANEDSASSRLSRDEAEKALVQAIGHLEQLMDEREVQEFRIRAAGYLRGRIWSEDAYAGHPTYAGSRSRNWVAWRAHELGWTAERFGEFERNMVSYGRMEHRIERIGKKYQWIAYHELTGRLADIALVDGSCRTDPQLFHGPWQVSTREMDPTILVTSTKQREPGRRDATWWSTQPYRWRDDPPRTRIAWMENESQDVPDPVQQIEVVDSNGRRWLVLATFVDHSHRVMVDGERRTHRAVWHKVTSMLVARKDVAKLVRLLTQSERARDRPPIVEMPTGGYLGEYPWHPAFADVDGHWEMGDSPGVQVEATTANWFVERSGHDYSIEDSFNVTIPAPALIRGLNLRLADGRSLAYATTTGEIVFKDPSVEELGFSAALVDRDALRAYLAKEGKEIVWIFTGEKSAHGGPQYASGWGGRLTYWGIYRFNGNSVEGNLSFEHQAASPEQLKVFMNNA